MSTLPNDRVKKRLLTTRLPDSAPEGKPVPKKEYKNDDYNEYDINDNEDLDDKEW